MYSNKTYTNNWLQHLQRMEIYEYLNGLCNTIHKEREVLKDQ
jgi:hypothetical protein